MKITFLKAKKKSIKCFLLVSLICFATVLNAQSDVVHKEIDGMLKVEAESFYKQTKTETRKWYVVSANFDSALKRKGSDLHFDGAGSEKYIEILPDTRSNHDEKLIPGVNFSNEPGRLAIVHYKVNFSRPGRYYVWVRAYSKDSEDNGIHVGIDGQWPESGQRMQWCDGKKSWKWGNNQRTIERHCGIPGFIFLDIEKAGEHEIQFSMREDGFEMDQWLMTTDKSYHPEKVN